MNLSEIQSKQILARYGVEIPPGGSSRSVEEAEARAADLASDRYVVKAQIRAGGRGEAGGVRIVETPEDVRRAAGELLGSRLVTEQTSAAGDLVAEVSVERHVVADRVIYLAVVVDERSFGLTVLGSREAGIDFERKAMADPRLVTSLRLGIDGVAAPERMAAFLAALRFDGAAGESLRALVAALGRAAVETDALMIEINPLAILADGRAMALDAKIVIDDNALFRHPELEELAAQPALDDTDAVARANDINFMRMEGSIGLVVNGAGLGLATNDMVSDAGGKPANFMDIRTTATSFQIAKGIQLLLADPSVRTILVNIHGGGMTMCDTVAEGLSFAYSRAARKPPIVFRAAGQNADWARSIMRDRRLPHEAVADMTAAVRRAVALAGGA